MLSILILTKNEELDLPGALAAVAFSDDVHVLDSESTDRTAAIATDPAARAAGVHFHTRPFDDYASQRNAGLALPFAHPWVFVLDADERPTPALLTEITQTLPGTHDSVAAFRIRRRDFFWGTWLKHAQMSPFYVRLQRTGRTRYTRAVNEVVEVNGTTSELREPFDHFPFSKGIANWITRHNHYSTREAELLAEGSFAAEASWRRAFFGPDFHTRRMAQKAIFYQLPARPLIKWLYLMFLRGALLDGPAGLMYATLQAIYEYFIELKVRELSRKRGNEVL
jgi:glycosyltransferase involved in cell wall biosynthesis